MSFLIFLALIFPLPISGICVTFYSLSSHLPPFAIISLILYQFSEADKRPSCTFVLETSCGKEGVFRVRNQESNLGEIFSMFQKSRSRVVNTLCIKCTFLVQGVFICFGFIACMSCLIINAFWQCSAKKVNLPQCDNGEIWALKMIVSRISNLLPNSSRLPSNVLAWNFMMICIFLGPNCRQKLETLCGYSPYSQGGHLLVSF